MVTIRTKVNYYIKIKNPIIIWENHKLFCNNLNIKGRIIIAKEGINGTISGNENDCNKYKQHVKKLLNINNIDFKQNSCKGHLFDKLSIKIKKEIIRVGVSIDPTIQTGIHLKPNEFKKMMKGSDTIILDMRSNKEHKLGKFKNAVTFDIDNLYDFPNKFEKHKLFLNKNNLTKKILTYCTGGIKCEKATSYLLNKGFSNVYQLKGGIIRYAMDANGEDFVGKCYVFDDRVGINVNKINPKNISKCYVCQIPFDIMVNCMNTICNRHTTICKVCYKNYDYCCSKECSLSFTKRKIYIDYYKTN